jgi:hypothetical protein
MEKKSILTTSAESLLIHPGVNALWIIESICNFIWVGFSLTDTVFLRQQKWEFYFDWGNIYIFVFPGVPLANVKA